MRISRHLARLGVVGLCLAGSVAVAPAASAMPPSAHVDGVYTCSNGQSYTVYVTDNNSPRGFIDGKAVVARAFQFAESGTLTVVGGQFDGDVIEFEATFGPAKNNGQVVKPSALKKTVTCTSSFSGPVEQRVLTAEDVQFLGIDPKYIGSTVTGSSVATITVYIGAQQLAHR